MPEPRRTRWRSGVRPDRIARRADLAEDVMGTVGLRGAGVLAGDPAPALARARSGLRGGPRRAGRPRVHPDRDRHPLTLLSAPDSCRARSPPGCSAAARASSASPRTAAASCTGCSRGRRRAAGRRRRVGRAGTGDGPGAARRPAGSCPASATTCTSRATRARPASCRSRARRTVRPAPAAVRGDGRVHAAVLGRTLPLNGAGVCGAALADLGLPLGCCAGSRCSPGPPG